MTAAILCPGPSLAMYKRDRWMDYDFQLAVNRAVRYAPCTHWVMCDKNPMAPEDRPGIIPHVFTSEHALQCMDTEGWPRPPMVTTLDKLKDTYLNQYVNGESGEVVCWDSFSSTSALVCAAYLGATAVDVYGADWTDEPDWDGKAPLEARRDAERWQTELPIWRAVVMHLGNLGVSVVRVTAPYRTCAS